MLHPRLRKISVNSVRESTRRMEFPSGMLENGWIEAFIDLALQKYRVNTAETA